MPRPHRTPALLLAASLAACTRAAPHTPAPATPITVWRLTPAAPHDVGLSDALPARLDALVTAAIADRASPGAALAVGRRGRIVVQRAWGRIDWAAGAPAATDSTLWDLASLTKVIGTTTAAMLLEEEGKLDVERTVASYLPEFATPEKSAITVRMLLLHTSGMHQYQSLYKDIKGLPAYVQAIAARPLGWPPGTHEEYADWNMIVLQAILERLAGTSIDAFLAERVFGPLGMRDTRYDPPASMKPRVAPTEVQAFRGGQVWGEVHDENAWALGGVAGHAGLFSSARDLAVFAQMLLDGGEYGGVRLLRPETIARWTARQRPDLSRALGWDTPSPGGSAGRFFSARSFGHTGFTGTSIWIDPEQQLFVILLTNRVNPSRDNPKLGPLRRAVADAVQGSVTDGPVRVWEGARANRP